MDIRPFINDIENFPKDGVIFKDISPLLKYKLTELMDHLYSLVDWDSVDYIIGVESRGFILGSALAVKANKGFIKIRKPGKLPPPIFSESYELEYGQDTLEIQINDNSAKVLVIDDVLATGGTLKASWNLCKKANYEVVNTLVLLNLSFLNSLDKKENNIISVLDL